MGGRWRETYADGYFAAADGRGGGRRAGGAKKARVPAPPRRYPLRNREFQPRRPAMR